MGDGKGIMGLCVGLTEPGSVPPELPRSSTLAGLYWLLQPSEAFLGLTNLRAVLVVPYNTSQYNEPQNPILILEAPILSVSMSSGAVCQGSTVVLCVFLAGGPEKLEEKLLRGHQDRSPRPRAQNPMPKIFSYTNEMPRNPPRTYTGSYRMQLQKQTPGQAC